MKIAIHPFENGLSDYWIPFLEKNNIPWKIVNCYSSNIIKEISDCTHLFWQWTQADPIAMQMALGLTRALEQKGIVVFPDSNNAWHFDNKVFQKYLFEAIDAPLANSYVFYSKIEAKNWAKTTCFPKVFKLKGGAGSNNVKLIQTKRKAIRLINKAFGRGYSRIDRKELFGKRLWIIKRDKNIQSVVGLFKGFARLFVPTDLERVLGKERGYIYFQDYIPGNDSDTRIIIIGNKAFAIKRGVREGDFRASGSGVISYDHRAIDLNCVKIAFDVAQKLNTQCLTFDFVHFNENPLIVEISYGFSPKGYIDCPGYWDYHLNFHQEKKPLAEYILTNVIANHNEPIN